MNIEHVAKIFVPMWKMSLLVAYYLEIVQIC